MSEETEYERRQENNNWHLDKRVPIALIISMLVQIVVLVWCAASINDSVRDHERRISTMEHYQENSLNGPSGMSERLTRVEVQQATAQKSLDRIETILATPAAPPQPGRDRR